MSNHTTMLMGLVTMMCLCALGQGVAPKATAPVIPEFSFSSDADAQKVFYPTDSPKVSWVQTGETGYVKLPMAFKGTTAARMCWDVLAKLDLSKSKGIAFDIYAEDVELLGGMTIYFKSGDGWYSSHFGIPSSGSWCHVEVTKSGVGTEGNPSGWGDISAIRLSFWTGQDKKDTFAAVANLSVLEYKSDIVVMTADSCIRPGNPENKGYSQFAAAIVRTLDTLGLESATVSDLDIAKDDTPLKTAKLLVMPYNPKISPEAITALEQFAERGGKFLALYSLPEGMESLFGVRRKGWEKCPTGAFKGYRATKDRLPGQPDLARQTSPHTVIMEPEPGSKVIATWEDSEGNDLGWPGAIASPRSVFLGHVWFSPGGENVSQFLLSIVGYLCPGIWEKSSRTSIDQIGTLGYFSGLSELREMLGKEATVEARRALDAACSLRDKAQHAFDKRDYWEAMSLCEQANARALEAYCRMARSVPGEHRGFWCHSAKGLPGKTWDEAIEILAKHGFNAIFPNMLWGGMAYYPSDVLPRYKGLEKEGDQVRLCLDACKKYGVACHVWKVNWNMGSHLDNDFVEKMVAEERVQVTYSSELKKTWLCPSHPANLRLEADSMVELVKKYPDLDGIHFDYIRYPDGNSCFCAGCRQRFEAKIGKQVEDWPKDTRAILREEWQDFRRENITALVKLVHQEGKAVRKSIQISAALFGNWMSDRNSVAQDWELWCRNGWLDFGCPMNYTDWPNTFKSQCTRQQNWRHKVPMYPGIGLSCWKYTFDPVNMVKQIEIARDLKTGGFNVFNYDNHALKVLPFMSLGCTKE